MIAQGSDTKINVDVTQTFTNSAGVQTTLPVDLTEFAGYIIFLYSKESRIVLQKYSANAAAGYVTIVPLDLANGKIQLLFDKSVSTDAPLGEVYGELATALTDSDFSLGIYETKCTFPIDKIVPSVTNGVSIPL